MVPASKYIEIYESFARIISISIFKKNDLYCSHDNSVLRSASFHGTGAALSLANDWSDNELNYCYEDNQVPPPSSPQLVCFIYMCIDYHIKAL